MNLEVALSNQDAHSLNSIAKGLKDGHDNDRFYFVKYLRFLGYFRRTMGIPFKIRLLLWKDRFLDKDTTGMDAVSARNYASNTIKKAHDLIDFPPIAMASTDDVSIAMRDGHEIKARIYKPKTDLSTLPVIIYYHGGGFVIYDIDSHDRVCRRLADKNDAIVVSIDYRLAPEFKFPTPVHDCYDSMLWVNENIGQYGGNTDRMSVAGDSAGGNLATVTCILSKENNGPRIHSQLLIYPTTDATLQFPSIERNGKGYLLSKQRMEWFVRHYAAEESHKVNPLMSPIYQKDLVGLPPAFVMTAQYDPLIDEGAAYAQKLKDAGVHTTYKMYKDMVHGFINMPKMAKPALQAHDDMKAFLDELEAV